MTTRRIAGAKLSAYHRGVRAAREQWLASQKKGQRKGGRLRYVRGILVLLMFALSLAIVFWVAR